MRIIALTLEEEEEEEEEAMSLSGTRPRVVRRRWTRGRAGRGEKR